MSELCLAADEFGSCCLVAWHAGMHHNECGEGWGSMAQYFEERRAAPGEFLDLLPHPR